MRKSNRNKSRFTKECGDKIDQDMIVEENVKRYRGLRSEARRIPLSLA